MHFWFSPLEAIVHKQVRNMCSTSLILMTLVDLCKAKFGLYNNRLVNPGVNPICAGV